MPMHELAYGSLGIVAFMSGDQAINHNELTEIVLDESRDDSGGFLQGGRIVVPESVGTRRFTIDAVASFAVNGTGDRIIELKVAHADQSVEVLTRGSDQGLTGTERMIRGGVSLVLKPGDEIYLEAFQTSGAVLNVRGGDLRWTYISVASY